MLTRRLQICEDTQNDSDPGYHSALITIIDTPKVAEQIPRQSLRDQL